MQTIKSKVEHACKVTGYGYSLIYELHCVGEIDLDDSNTWPRKRRDITLEDFKIVNQAQNSINRFKQLKGL